MLLFHIVLICQAKYAFDKIMKNVMETLVLFPFYGVKYRKENLT